MKSFLTKCAQVGVFLLVVGLLGSVNHIIPLRAQTFTRAATPENLTITVSPSLSQTTVTAYSVSGLSPVNGALPVSFSAPMETAAYTWSQVATSSASNVQLTVAVAGIKSLFLQNQSAANAYVSTTSPVTASNGFTLGAFGTPESRKEWTRASPNAALYAIGASSVAQTIAVGVGQ